MIERTITAITIDHKTGNGRYSDVLDVAEYISATYGSPTNSIAIMVRDSALFKKAVIASRKVKRRQPLGGAS